MVFAIPLSVLLFFACTKKNSEVPKSEPIKPLVIQSSALVDIRASSVSDFKNSIERKIELINRKQNFVFDVFNIIYKTDSKASVSEQMNSKFFNGTLVILNKGKVIETWNIVNNVANYKSQPLQSQRTITT